MPCLNDVQLDRMGMANLAVLNVKRAFATIDDDGIRAKWKKLKTHLIEPDEIQADSIGRKVAAETENIECE